MATRSAIGWVRPDGLIRAVYCHWDGSPSHQLPILNEHYNNAAKACSLVAKGSMSSLRTENTWDDAVKRDPQPLYHYERGDNGPWNASGRKYAMPPVTFSTPKEAIDHFRDMGCEHLYIYYPCKGWMNYEIPWK